MISERSDTPSSPRHARLFELLRQRELARRPMRKPLPRSERMPVQPDAMDLLRDRASGSLLRPGV